ncbi:pyridoxal phosphate-dependent aminotransferase [Streptomyces fagopyri]|uniref:pyridoxal phosphate-dependent aminotransferase n=1 Tax=Streptomyces fagopyri TaxID=2662397 RepID=UPI0033D6A69C
MQLFAAVPRPRLSVVPEEARAAAALSHSADGVRRTFDPGVDERVLEVFSRARDPRDPFELRDLWLGRIEHELGHHSHRPGLAQKWRTARQHRVADPAEVLSSRATVRFVKEMFNWYFRDDLYGDLHSDSHLILSSGSVDEERWGLPSALKHAVQFALDRDWYGYSDSRGRVPAREAIAAYETARVTGAGYTADNVAMTMGGTFAISSLADFILHNAPDLGEPVLCGTPNYPPLVESIARRREVRLVPLPCEDGQMSLGPLIAALTPNTPMVMLQTAANPTGAVVSERELTELIRAAAPTTMIVLDECHEWLGPSEPRSAARAAPNVIRVSSLSKAWSAPGLKIGWFLADQDFVSEYYEYASTAFGGPPSFFYTLVEVVARMERWLLEGVGTPGAGQAAEFEKAYEIDLDRLQSAYQTYRSERLFRQESLTTLREATTTRLSDASGAVIVPRCSINTTVEFAGWTDSYLCFRDILRETGVSVFPTILTFGLSGGAVRVTTARPWDQLSDAITRIGSYLAVPVG